jgi:hypothetical protein
MAGLRSGHASFWCGVTLLVWAIGVLAAIDDLGCRDLLT